MWKILKKAKTDRSEWGLLGKIFLKPYLFYGIEFVQRGLIANVKQVAIETSRYTDTCLINFYHSLGK